MTVAELIERLQRYDPNLDVRYCSNDPAVIDPETLLTEDLTESVDIVEMGADSDGYRFVALV